MGRPQIRQRRLHAFFTAVTAEFPQPVEWPLDSGEVTPRSFLARESQTDLLEDVASVLPLLVEAFVFLGGDWIRFHGSA